MSEKGRAIIFWCFLRRAIFFWEKHWGKNWRGDKRTGRATKISRTGDPILSPSFYTPLLYISLINICDKQNVSNTFIQLDLLYWIYIVPLIFLASPCKRPPCISFSVYTDKT